MRKIRLLVLSILLTCILSSCAYYRAFSPSNPKFKQHSTSGSLKTGMTEEEIKGLFGNPNKIGERKTVYDIRAVWTYKQYQLWGPAGQLLYLTGCTITFGLICLLPGPTEYHYLVLSDGILIGWDIPDPYAPDLIVERRERQMSPLEKH